MFQMNKTKIALCGTTESGKTTFLTSLLWHLEQDSFSINGNVAISEYTSLKIKKGPEFPFKKRKSELLHQTQSQWVTKTKDASKFIVQFARSDWWLYQCLEFVDIPGERFNDAAIAEYPQYDDWASYQLDDVYYENSPMGPYYNGYLEKLEQGQSAKDYVNAYKVFLSELVSQHETSLISPSVFLLNKDGQHISKLRKSESIEDTAKSGFAGIKGQQFCPLPLEILEKNPSVHDAFRKHYSEYRKSIVLPIFSELYSSQKVLLFIDIPNLLMSGDLVFNAQRQILSDILKSFNPNTPLWKTIWRYLPRIENWRPTIGGSVYDIAFIASKADLVLPKDMNNLKALLSELTKNAARKSRQHRCKRFCCSAVSSTKITKDDELSVKSPVHNGQRVNYPVTRVPSEWPKEWKPGKYKFPAGLLADVSSPPDHYNLDKIFNYIVQ